MPSPRHCTRHGAGILILTFAWLFWLGIVSPVFAQQAPLLSGTLPSRTVLPGTSDQLDLNPIFTAQDAPGTVVQLTIAMSGTDLVSGTSFINLALSDSATPVTVANFLTYVRAGAYDHSFFHRSYDKTGFTMEIIQGGGFLITDGTSDLSAATLAAVPDYGEIANEYSDSQPNAPGTIAMARLSGSNTASSQWFINVGDNSAQLNSSNGGGYAVFGKVLGNGMSTANAIFGLPVNNLAGRIDNNLDASFTEFPLSVQLPGTGLATIPRPEVAVVQSARVVPSLAFTATSSNPAIAAVSVSTAGVLSLTYLGQGTATVTVTATDLDGNATPASFGIAVEPPSSALVGFESGNLSVSGTCGTALLDVVCTGEISGTCSVQYSTANGTALNGIDYTAASGTLNFTASGTDQLISIPITSSTVPVPGKTFSVQLSAPANGAILGTASTATVTILDNTANPAGILQFSAPSYSADHFGSLEVEVTRTAGSSGTVSAVVSTADGSAVNGVDYSGAPQLVTFDDGDTATKTVSIPLLDSSQASASFTVSLQNPTGGATLGATASATATVYFTNFIEFARPNYTVDRSLGKAVVTVLRSGTAEPATVAYTTSDTLVPNAKRYYTATSGTLTFPAGSASQNIQVPIRTTAPEQSFQLTLSNPRGAALTTGSQTTVTIATASSSASVQFSGSSYLFDSNTSSSDYGNAHVVTLVRSGNINRPVMVYVELIDGSAMLGENYFAFYSGSSDPVTRVLPVSFRKGESTQSIDLLGVVNGAESLELKLIGSDDGTTTVGKTGTATVTFLDRNNPQGLIEFPQSTYQADETSGTAYITVSRTETTGTASFRCSTANGTAKANVDYVALSGSNNPWFSFAPGESTATAKVTLLPNPAKSPATRSFQIMLTQVSGSGAELGAANQSATVTLVEENNPKGVFEFESPAYSVSDGSGWAELMVLRHGGATGAADVMIGTEDNYSDVLRNVFYSWPGPSNIPLWAHFEPGQDRQELLIPLIPGAFEQTGTSSPVQFSAYLAYTTAGILGTGSTTVISDYASENLATPSVEFKSTQYRVNDNAQVFALNAALYGSGSTTSPMSVPFVITPGNALPGTDFGPGNGFDGIWSSDSGTLTFEAGAISAEIPFTVSPGSALEPEKRFSVQLQPPAGGLALLSQTTATVTIISQAAKKGVFQLEKPAYSFDEDCGAFEVNIVRGGSSASAATVIVATNDGSASGDQFDIDGVLSGFGNYGSNTQTLTFTKGEMQKPFFVPVRNRALTSGSASLIVRIESADTGAQIGARDSAVVTLYSLQNVAATSVDFDSPFYKVTGSTGIFSATVRRTDPVGSAAASGTLTVGYSILSGSTATVTTGTTGTVTLAPGQATAQISGGFTVTSTGQLTIQLSNPRDITNPSTNVALLGNNPATVIIQQKNPYGVFEFDSPVYGIDLVASSSTAQILPVRIVRSGNLTRAASVRISPLGTVVNFGAGVAEKQVDLQLAGASVTVPSYLTVELVSTGSGAVGFQNMAFVNPEPIPPTSLPAVGFANSSYAVDVTDTNASVVVSLYASGTDPVTVPYSTVATAISGAAFAPTSGTLTLTGTGNATSSSGASVVTGTISVPLNNGSKIAAPDRVFLWRLGVPSTTGSAPVALMGNWCVPDTIQGFNNPHGVVGFQYDTYSIERTRTVNLKVTRQGGTAGRAIFAVLVTAGSSADYNSGAFSYIYDGMNYQLITFDPGTSFISVPVSIRAAAGIGDTVTLELIATNNSGGASLDAEHSTTTITVAPLSY